MCFVLFLSCSTRRRLAIQKAYSLRTELHLCGLTTRLWSPSVHGTSHPIRVRVVMAVPYMASCSRHFSEKRSRQLHSVKKTQSHTLECGTKGHKHSSPPSLFSASHNIYSKHMSGPIRELKL